MTLRENKIVMTDELLSEDFDFENLAEVDLVTEEELKKATEATEVADDPSLEALQIFMRDVGMALSKASWSAR